jgi:hypothetical protein
MKPMPLFHLEELCWIMKDEQAEENSLFAFGLRGKLILQKICLFQDLKIAL